MFRLPRRRNWWKSGPKSRPVASLSSFLRRWGRRPVGCGRWGASLSMPARRQCFARGPGRGRRLASIMKVFVTGACGYKGSVLVPKLIAAGHSVVAFDIQWFGNFLRPHPALTVQKGDVRHLDEIDLSG